MSMQLPYTACEDATTENAQPCSKSLMYSIKIDLWRLCVRQLSAKVSGTTNTYDVTTPLCRSHNMLRLLLYRIREIGTGASRRFVDGVWPPTENGRFFRPYRYFGPNRSHCQKIYMTDVMLKQIKMAVLGKF